jgi:hypothetical protein
MKPRAVRCLRIKPELIAKTLPGDTNFYDKLPHVEPMIFKLKLFQKLGWQAHAFKRVGAENSSVHHSLLLSLLGGGV